VLTFYVFYVFLVFICLTVFLFILLATISLIILCYLSVGMLCRKLYCSIYVLLLLQKYMFRVTLLHQIAVFIASNKLAYTFLLTSLSQQIEHASLA